MFILRFLLLYSLSLVYLHAEKNSVLSDYYQSLLDTSSFYYELDVIIQEDYVKKILDKDLTLDLIIENEGSDKKVKLSSESNINPEVNIKSSDDYLFLQNNDKNQKLQKAQIVKYKELKDQSYMSIVKLLKLDSNIKEGDKKELSLSKEIVVRSYKNIKEEANYLPLTINNFDINYLDYFMIYYSHYNFELIKATSDSFFYRGTLKDSKDNLFTELSIKFSKEYNIPTRIILKDVENNMSVSVEVEEVEKISEVYIGSKISIFDNGKKVTLYAKNITLGVPIEIENNYKISLNEYIDLTSETK